MNEKILDQLDYNRIKNEISTYCMSQEGKLLVQNAKPLSDKVQIQKKKDLASEWTHLLKFTRSVRINPWNEISEAIKLLGVENSCLSVDEAFSLGQFCLSVNAMTSVFDQNSDYNRTCPNISREVSSLYDFSLLQNKIFHLIDQNGEIREVEEIREIKKSIRRKQTEIERTLKSFTTNPDLQDSLQSTLPVLRSGRQVIAVKSGSKNKIKGIVHEVSQTGSTMYIEPDQVVQASNELMEEEARLVRQVKLLLTELTSFLSGYKDQFIHNLYVMSNLDYAYASAQWGIERKASFARFCNFEENENLSLVQARHPVLEDKAVPIDIVFNPNVRVLIITGANTGGKTVTLKTIALFALLNQSGFPLPAQEDSCLPIFSKVFADIGDEQSLDESLSTFSGHMKNIGQILNEADQDSLVLLDELGSGTDPQEGGAIAMAVLDNLIQKNCFVILTTHHGVIKNYGYTHEKCLNASVEFDQKTLSPTYKILMGVPGASHAIEIAERSGIEPSVIERA
ncbi:MAG: endonuclease MutS2, partial [Treponemataceae bacterium]|nr:endonuclease MutS2 [Treponemataceae bacterium]